jgi:LysR family glycine cleavage system transcriptional activator
VGKLNSRGHGISQEKQSGLAADPSLAASLASFDIDHGGSHNNRVPRVLPPLHALIAFDAIARHRNMAYAARELGVTRSALTHSIGILERQLQVRLFLRTTPVAELSTAGKYYHDAVHLFARSAGDALFRLSSVSRVPLRLSVTPGFARLWLGPRMQSFVQRHPRVDLNLTVADTPVEAELQQSDIVIRYGRLAPHATLAMPLWRETLVAVSHPALAATTQQMDLGKLVRTYSLLEHPQFSWNEWLTSAHGGQWALQPTLVCRDIVMVLEAAAAGSGLALAPRRMMLPYLQQRRLSIAHPVERPGDYFYAYALESNMSRPPVTAFLAWMSNEVHESAQADLGVFKGMS